MNILFVVPRLPGYPLARDLLHGCWCWGARIGDATFPPTSLAAFASLVRSAGGEADVHDFNVQGDRSLEGWDFIGILTSSHTFAADTEAVGGLKARYPGIRTLWVGTHPTFEPQTCLEHPVVDYVVVGEPETALVEFLRSGSARGVYGAGAALGSMESLTWADRIDDLDILPMVDRTIGPSSDLYPNPFCSRRYATVTSSRGCPGRCTFCTAGPFYGRRYRAQSSGRVLKELVALVEAGYRDVFFRDENFTMQTARVVEICDGILSRGLSFRWICSSRVDQVDRDLLAHMKKAGCRMVRFGVETGTQKGLDSLHKGVALDQVRSAFRWCGEAGLETHAHFMLGLPGETPDDTERTIRFSLELGATYATFGLFTPMPGTPLWDPGKSSLECLDALHYGGSNVSQDLSQALGRAYRCFYFRPTVLAREAMKGLRRGDFCRRVVAGAALGRRFRGRIGRV